VHGAQRAGPTETRNGFTATLKKCCVNIGSNCGIETASECRRHAADARPDFQHGDLWRNSRPTESIEIDIDFCVASSNKLFKSKCVAGLIIEDPTSVAHDFVGIATHLCTGASSTPWNELSPFHHVSSMAGVTTCVRAMVRSRPFQSPSQTQYAMNALLIPYQQQTQQLTLEWCS